MKFSCPQCSQHISCDEAWAGHQIDCPGCHSSIVVPQFHPPQPPPPPAIPAREAPAASGPKLAAGATQVARPTAHAPAPVKKTIPRRPRSQNSLVGYAILLAVVVGLGCLGYFYGLPLLKDAFQQTPGSSSDTASPQGGARGGPLGEVDAAMDVSDTLDGGSSPKPRQPPATNNTARPRPASRPR